MKMKVRSVAFALLLAPAILFADSINVTFDAALTNMTAWTYVGNIKTSKNGDYYINGQDVRITSPCYDFTITSIVMRVSTSGSCTRNLIISSCDNETISQPQEFTNIPQGTSSDITATWNIADRVRTLAITSTSGAQNLYFHSAVISGVPIVEAPTNLQTDNITGTRCRLLWTNPENAVSNKIEVSQVVWHEESSTMLDEYDFMALTNNNTNASLCLDKNNLQMDYYPAFSGTNIYAAGNSTGVVQISSRENRGSLKYDLSAIKATLDESADISLLVSAKRHSSDTSGTYGLKITVVDANDNSISCITNNLVYEFPEGPVVVPLQEASSGTSVILEPSDTAKTNRRILIDYLAFVRDYSPASVSTNLVKTVFASGTTATIRGLSPYSSYIASITAFDAEGNESEPSEPISFMTNGSELPLVIRLQ